MCWCDFLVDTVCFVVIFVYLVVGFAVTCVVFLVAWFLYLVCLSLLCVWLPGVGLINVCVLYLICVVGVLYVLLGFDLLCFWF